LSHNRSSGASFNFTNLNENNSNSVQRPLVLQFKQKRFSPSKTSILTKSKKTLKDDPLSRGSSDLKQLAQASTKAYTKHDTYLTSPRELDRNEELMSLLACLNEQAVKELSCLDNPHEFQIGQQRLHKAYKIIVETKNPGAFDANYKAIICYNLACSYQLQGELSQVSVFL